MDIRNRDSHYYDAGPALARIARTRNDIPTHNKPRTSLPDGTRLRPSTRRLERRTGLWRRLLLMGLYMVCIVGIPIYDAGTLVANPTSTTMPNGATEVEGPTATDPEIVLNIWDDTKDYLIDLAAAGAALWGSWWAWSQLQNKLTA